jgi:type VI secretion system protein VasG
MVGVNMTGLINKCNSFCVQMLNTAAGFTVNRAHYEVTVEHFLAACLEAPKSDICLIATQENDANALAKLKQEVNTALETFRTGNSGRPVFSPLLQELLEAAWLVSSVDLGMGRIRTGSVLLALLHRPSFYLQGGYTALLSRLNRENIQENFAKLTVESEEDSGTPASGAAASGMDGKAASANAAGQGGESFLARFCEDFTAKAQAGKLDAVFGRDAEIRQMVDILARRRKNNPILVGEPGVGKTAVMEGLALRITQGDVPETLRGVTLLGLDMGLLEAGASMKGEFERRLKGVLDEIKGSASPIILFIDEAHLLVGSGQGGSDAANLMKPALARGEIRTCAATTWKEYKKYFEKDPALARRFQLVSLAEPSVETTALILRGLCAGYEKAHDVLVRDDAIEAAATLSARYITGRFLPDKAVDLLDTACARVKVSLASVPAALEDCRRKVQADERELAAVDRDSANGLVIDSARRQALVHSIEEGKQRSAALEVEWRAEKEAAQGYIAARQALHEARMVQTDSTQAREAFIAARAALEACHTEERLISVEVSADTVAKVVSDWTGIPVGKMARDQAETISHLKDVLLRRIQGQDAALDAVVQGVQASKAGLRSPDQPMGVFLLVGPSGVGKTETGLALADALFGNEKNVITINMSEFQEKHTTSRLIGSPPGYVGYGEGGMLTEAVRRTPYAVVLLDEVEKAHLDVMQLFYQVFDKGTLTDGEGTEVSFKNTLILLTSNLASDIIQEMTGGDDADELTADMVSAAIRPVLSQHFQPALLARMQVVPYVSLRAAALHNIVLLKLGKLKKRLQQNNGMELVWTEAVPAQIVERCTEVETGARNIDYILNAAILPDLSRAILANMSSGTMPKSVSLDVNEQQEFCIGFTPAETSLAAEV